ncbi:MAG: hypothetical protein OQK73_09855 [Gammaproteobacteria bacterium]|nr:hypothetical protein [Gammaproteobacteria bacterium]
MSLVVKSHRPLVSRMLWLLGILAMLIAGWSLFDYGRYLAGYDSAEMEHERGILLDLKMELEHEIDQLREEKALLERASQIERQAYAELDATLKVLQEEILELKEELAFYRGIVSPRDASSGLQLQTFKIEPNGQSNNYRYKVVLTQVLKNDRLATGRVKLFIDGLHNGVEPVTLELKDVSEKQIKELSYRFKYFQSLDGDLALPAQFKPLRITLQITPSSRKQGGIEKTIEWTRQEKEINVGNEEETKTDSAD